MKPIENIFGFDCSTCEHNRHCYGGNMGNQFRYCQKSAEKIQNLDSLEIKLKKQKEVNDKAIEYISNKKAIINTDVIRIFDLFEIDEQGYTNELLNILKGDSNDC